PRHRPAGTGALPGDPQAPHRQVRPTDRGRPPAGRPHPLHRPAPGHRAGLCRGFSPGDELQRPGRADRAPPASACARPAADALAAWLTGSDLLSPVKKLPTPSGKLLLKLFAEMAMTSERQFSPLDRLLMQADAAMRTLLPFSGAPARPTPATLHNDGTLSEEEARHVAGLMRINHTGEVCAQALYQGQALTAKLPEVRKAMEHAADEEIDHLAWCEQRI